MDLAFGETVDMRIGGVTFFATERGYDLFAKAVDQSTVVYMNLASGHMETIKGSSSSSSSPSFPLPPHPPPHRPPHSTFISLIL